MSQDPVGMAERGERVCAGEIGHVSLEAVFRGRPLEAKTNPKYAPWRPADLAFVMFKVFWKCFCNNLVSWMRLARYGR